MLVLVEGVDGSGKTTLVRKLFEKGYCCKRVFRNGNKEARKFYNYAYRDGIVVLDRSFISDYVYRQTDLQPREDLDLEQIGNILNGDVAIIHCVNAYHYDDAMERGEDNITDKDTSEWIASLYCDAMKVFTLFTNVKVFIYDYHNTTVDEVDKFIKEVYNECKKDKTDEYSVE